MEKDPRGGDRLMAYPFRVLEHTADVGFEAFGASLREVFANAARALVHLAVDLESIAPREAAEIRATGTNSQELLVNWLSEILYLQDTGGVLFRDFEIAEMRGHSLMASARGEKLDQARHAIKLQVKAVTYHQLVLERTPRGWRAQVYVDI